MPRSEQGLEDLRLGVRRVGTVGVARWLCEKRGHTTAKGITIDVRSPGVACRARLIIRADAYVRVRHELAECIPGQRVRCTTELERRPLFEVFGRDCVLPAKAERGFRSSEISRWPNTHASWTARVAACVREQGSGDGHGHRSRSHEHLACVVCSDRASVPVAGSHPHYELVAYARTAAI